MRTSAWCASSQSRTRASRDLTELTFQLAISIHASCGHYQGLRRRLLDPGEKPRSLTIVVSLDSLDEGLHVLIPKRLRRLIEYDQGHVGLAGEQPAVMQVA